MRLLIIGGTGHFSGRITERAAAQGHEVVLYNRGHRPLPQGITEPVIRREHDGNYGSIFSFWDRLFGTYHRRPDPENLELGLRDFRDEEWLDLAGMLRTPLR